MWCYLTAWYFSIKVLKRVHIQFSIFTALGEIDLVFHKEDISLHRSILNFWAFFPCVSILIPCKLEGLEDNMIEVVQCTFFL